MIRLKFIINKVLEKLGYRLERVENYFFQYLIQLLYFKKQEDFFFIQVGANNGRSADPLHDFIIDYRPNGILIEPQEDIFRELKKTYSNNKNLKFANIALDNKIGYKTFFSIKEPFRKYLNIQSTLRGYKVSKPYFPNMPRKCEITGIGSFSEEHVKKYLRNNLGLNKKEIDVYIEAKKVKTLTFNEFLNRYKVNKTDLIQIDTEGYDYEIIKMINFNQLYPTIINYESKNLSKYDRRKCETFLVDKGYKLFRHGGDTCAYNFGDLNRRNPNV